MGSAGDSCDGSRWRPWETLGWDAKEWRSGSRRRASTWWHALNLPTVCVSHPPCIFDEAGLLRCDVKRCFLSCRCPLWSHLLLELQRFKRDMLLGVRAALQLRRWTLPRPSAHHLRVHTVWQQYTWAGEKGTWTSRRALRAQIAARSSHILFCRCTTCSLVWWNGCRADTTKCLVKLRRWERLRWKRSRNTRTL